MAEIQIITKRSFGYDDKYDIEIRTTKDLSQEEYATIVSSMDAIKKIFDTHIDVLTAKVKAKEQPK